MNKHAREIVCYVINGLVATGVHYAVLTFNIHLMLMPTAGLANFIAALFGISASFIGSRYFVFPQTGANFLPQATKFAGFYGAIAVLHGLVLLICTDWLGHDYRMGFLLASAMQMSLSYLGNKFLIFKK